MPEKISIMRESGETLSSNIVAIFTIPDTEKHYVITTENAVDPHGLTVLHVSENVDGVLKKIATDDEWATIKTIMRSIISGSAGSFKYEPLLTTIKAEAQYSRDISVSASASKQIIDSYMASLQESGEEGNSSEEVVLEDVNEITPGISEVVSENVDQQKAEEVAVVPEAPVAPPVAEVAPVVEDITSTAQENVSVEEKIGPVVSEGAPSNGTVVLNAVSGGNVPAATSDIVVESAPVEEKAKDIVPVDSTVEVESAVVTEKVVVHEPVVAYVDPAFQQLLTNDYNQMLMCVQNIQNMISQVAAMPALNYQPSYNMNSNGVPNFNPNASVDEIISGSTEVFAEGVKNLVATITEKMYRDLFEREADLKRREELLLQRETMLNNQMSALANLAQPMSQPVVQEGITSEPVSSEGKAAEEVRQVEQQPVSEQPVVETQPQAVESQPVVEQQPVMEQQPVVQQQIEQGVPEEVNQENQGINVVQAQVKIETPMENEEKVEEEVAETTVPAQQNTAPVAEPVSPEAEVAEEAVPVAETIPVAEAAAPITNTVPQPVQTVEIV